MTKLKSQQSTHHSLQKHKPLIGIALAILAGFLVTTMNMFVKFAGESYTPMEIVFYRGCVILAVLLPFLLLSQKIYLLKSKNPKLHFLRSLIGTLSVIIVYWAYIIMPMADATALLMLSGLIVTALSMPFLGEKVGIIRWSAVFSGFLGALYLIQPTGSDLFNFYAIVPLLGAFTIAGVALFLRRMSSSEPPVATITYFMIFSTIVSGLYLLLSGNLKLISTGFVFIICVGFFAATQQFAKTYANQFAEASSLSPYAYLTLVWAVFYDVIFWSDWPEVHIWIGSAIILASNLIVIWREKHIKNKS